MRRWVGLLAAASLATAVNAEMLLNPWRGITDLESRVNRREERLQAQIDHYTRAGAFPKVWRSLHSKIREANAFLEREMAKEEQRGVGASVAIVYEDEVRQSCSSQQNEWKENNELLLILVSDNRLC